MWLRYLAIVVLVGAGLAAFWNLVGLGRMILQGAFDGIGLAALNLALSLATIALAVTIAAPGRQSVGVGVKILALPSVASGGLGVLSLAAVLFASTWGQQAGSPLDPFTDMSALDVVLLQELVESSFFSVCTLAFAILVLVSRRRVA